MKPERIWIAVVLLLLMGGFATWIASDERLPSASVWLWLAGFAIAFLPAVIALSMAAWNAVSGYFVKRHKGGGAPPS